jgi:hypothetical protein
MVSKKAPVAAEEVTAVDADGVSQEEVVPAAEPEADAAVPEATDGEQAEGGAEETPTADAGAETDAATDAEPAATETEQSAAAEEPEDEEPDKSGDSDEDSAG